MKTINKRVEALENGVGSKPILVLWEDYENPDICRDKDGEAFSWAEAEARYESEYTLICVRYVDDWHDEKR